MMPKYPVKRKEINTLTLTLTSIEAKFCEDSEFDVIFCRKLPI